MEIRQCTENNAREIARIIAFTWQTAYDGMLPASVLDVENLRLRIECLHFYNAEALKNNWIEAYLMEKNGVNFGCFSFGTAKDPDADLTVAELKGMYILGGYRHKGYGSECLNFIEHKLKKQNYKKLTLWVLNSNIKPISFYIKHGFKHDGACRDVVLGKYFIEQRFSKLLN